MYVITAKNISKKFINGSQKNVLFNDLSLYVHEGEIIYIRGQYGSGRTTLLKMIAAMTPPNQGTIEVLGKNLLSIQKRSDWRIENIGFLTNEEALVPYLNVKQQLLMGREETAKDFVLFNEEAQYILTMLGIDEQKLSLYPEQLSTVQRLKVTLARVLMTNPRLLLIDEFTFNLNEEDRFELYNILVEFSRLQNITLLITGENESHHIADRVLKLENGKLIEDQCSKESIVH